MNAEQKAIARACATGAENDTMSFPQIVGTLIESGFEGYAVDFRRSMSCYYLPDGSSVEIALPAVGIPISPAFDAEAIRAAIREAQQLVPGYTYAGFCRKTALAGCAGYIVSFSGRRALYYGRTAETHVELFPDASGPLVASTDP